MRPVTLDDIVGQRHILGEGKLLRRVIEADRLTKRFEIKCFLFLSGVSF